MISKLYSKIASSFLLMFVHVQVFADIYNPTGSSGTEQEVQEKVGNIYDAIAVILGSVFGLVAVVSLSIIAFTFFKDREKAMDQIWSWGGAIALFSTVGTIVAMIFSATN